MEIVARLTANAAIRQLPNGKSVVNFNVAINESYKPKGSDTPVNMTQYVRCAFWRNTAIAAHLKKGQLVELSGRIGAQAWNDKEGKPKASLTMNVADIKFHGKVVSGNGPQPPKNQTVTAEDDLPF